MIILGCDPGLATFGLVAIRWVMRLA